jgi:hypothetical protein
VAFLAFAFLAFFPLARSVSAISITVSIPEKYSEVKVGEKVYFETEVKWPENVGRKDLRVEYSVRDSNDKEVGYLKVLKAIETQASFMDSVTISESTSPGTYRINAKFSDYSNLNQEVTTSFKVIRGDIKSQTYIFIIMLLLFILSFFVFNSIVTWLKRRSVAQPSVLTGS